jgi:hypothetical protein
MINAILLNKKGLKTFFKIMIIIIILNIIISLIVIGGIDLSFWEYMNNIPNADVEIPHYNGKPGYSSSSLNELIES